LAVTNFDGAVVQNGENFTSHSLLLVTRVLSLIVRKDSVVIFLDVELLIV
jgi:hypothetical protein